MKVVKPPVKAKAKKEAEKKVILNSELKYSFQLLESLKYLKLGGINGKLYFKNKSAILTAEKEFDGVRITLCEQYCEKDKSGAPVKVDGVYKFAPKALKDFNVEMQKVLDEDSGVILHLIDPGVIDQFKDATGEQVEALMFMSKPE